MSFRCSRDCEGEGCPACATIKSTRADLAALKARVAELEDMLRTADRRIDLDKRDSDGAAERFEAMTKAAVLAEREACALAVEEARVAIMRYGANDPADNALDAAVEAIRARGGQ